MAKQGREWSTDPEAGLRARYGLGADTPIAGVDEVGRGAWAGPLCVAAVVLPKKISPWLAANIDDSKCVRPAMRAVLAKALHAEAQVEFAWGSLEAIEEHNILGATLIAMRHALEALTPTRAAAALIDGNRLPTKLSVPACAVIGGDRIVLSIAAASIVAKVARDAWMETLDRDYPQYGFARHRGYGTDIHRKALHQFGPSPIHRAGYRPVREARIATARSIGA